MDKKVRVYLIYTFLIMAACWGMCVICGQFGVNLTDFPLLYVPYLVGGLSPTIASYIVQKRYGEVRGFGEWLRNIFDVKHSVYSYLLLPALAAAFFVSLCCISGFEAGAPLAAVVVMIPVMLFGGGLEETGWRGILQPELEKKYGYILATILVALVWWLWHLPLFFIPGVAQYGADFIEFGLNVLGLSFALGAIRKLTNSTWLCILFHCLINSLHGVYIVRGSLVGGSVAAVVLIIFSCVLIWVQERKQLFR